MERSVALAVASLFLVLASGVPTAGAHTRPCRVRNATTNVFYAGQGDALQTAIDAASNGDALKVAGLCTGNFSIGKDLALTGVSFRGFPKPTLDGDAAGSRPSRSRPAP